MSLSVCQLSSKSPRRVTKLCHAFTGSIENQFFFLSFKLQLAKLFTFFFLLNCHSYNISPCHAVHNSNYSQGSPSITQFAATRLNLLTRWPYVYDYYTS